jgi:glycosyltransferase domain-containing protein
MSLFKDLTLIIATYGQRHHFVQRTCQYWKDTGVHILILDASVNTMSVSEQALLSSTTKYLHFPQVDYFIRLRTAIEQVKTKYAIMHPDDDFNFKSVVQKCIVELEGDQNLYVCDGVYSWFSYFKGNLFSLKERAITKTLIQLTEDPVQRLEASFNGVFLYGVWKTEMLKICFKKWPQRVSSPAVFCMVFQWCLAYLGKWKTLNELMWMRSYEVEPSSERDGIKRSFYFHEWYQGVPYQKEVEETISGMVSTIAETSKGDVLEIRNNIVNVFIKNAQLSINEFGNSTYNPNQSLTWRKHLLNLLPVAWIKTYRRLRYQNTPPSGELMENQVAWLRNQGVQVNDENIKELHNLLSNFYK